MRTITDEKLKDILEKHKKWLTDEDAGERANLRYVYLQGFDLQGADLRKADLQGADLQFTKLQGADLREANLRFTCLQCVHLQETNLWDANVYDADLKRVYRPWLVYAGNIGSRRYETLYFADYDSVRCGCWNDYKGGTLAEFKARIDEVYPSDSENEEYQRYRLEYLSAIKMFENMRKAYLAKHLRHIDNEQ